MRRPTLLVSFLVAAGALSGCGIRNTVHQKALADLQACQGKLGATETQRDTALARADKAEKELGAAPTPAQREATEALAKLTVEVAPTEDELRAVRNHREHAQKWIAQTAELEKKLAPLSAAGKLIVRSQNHRFAIEVPAANLFQANQATLTKSGKERLAELLAIVQPLEWKQLLVAAHTDNTPLKGRRWQSKTQLSRARAEAVADQLIAAGFHPADLLIIGAGELLPVADNADAAGRARNDRVELFVMPDSSALRALLGRLD